MPILDRYWWLWWLAGAYIAAAGIEYAGWSYTSRYSPLGNGCFVCLLWVVMIGAAGMALWLIVRGFQARERKVRRLRAISGDLEAMRVARIGVDVARLQLVKLLHARAASLSQAHVVHPWPPQEHSVTLLWRWSTLWESPVGGAFPRWRVLVVGLTPLLVCGLASFTCGWLLGVLPSHLDLGEFLWGAFPFAWFVPYQVYVGYMIFRPTAQSVFLIPFRRSPFGIVANDESIEERTRFGDRHTVRWADARLLEVRFLNEQGSRTGCEYILCGKHGAIGWTLDYLFPRQDVVPDGIPREEMEGRSRQLLDLIAARCGLVARTLDPKLQAAAQPAGPRAAPTRI